MVEVELNAGDLIYKKKINDPEYRLGRVTNVGSSRIDLYVETPAGSRLASLPKQYCLSGEQCKIVKGNHLDKQVHQGIEVGSTVILIRSIWHYYLTLMTKDIEQATDSRSYYLDNQPIICGKVIGFVDSADNVGALLSIDGVYSSSTETSPPIVKSGLSRLITSSIDIEEEDIQVDFVSHRPAELYLPSIDLCCCRTISNQTEAEQVVNQIKDYANIVSGVYVRRIGSGTLHIVKTTHTPLEEPWKKRITLMDGSNSYPVTEFSLGKRAAHIRWRSFYDPDTGLITTDII